MKICSTCKQAKPLTEFRKDKRARDGRKSQCKACMKKYEKTRDQSKKRDYAKRYRAGNRETERARYLRWKEENPDKFKSHKKAMKILRRSDTVSEYENGITVEALYEASKGICKICGGICDLNDYRYVGDTFVAGDNYPSIDHIIPLSKGGSHTWANVQLAHRICNSHKYNKTS